MSDAGYHDMRHFMSKEVEIPITDVMFKEFIWRQVQVAMTGKKSTTKLDKADVDKVYQVISRHLATEFGINVPFPSEESRDESPRD